MATLISLSAAVEEKLREITRNIGTGSVSVGFLAGATYPNGTPVASVAFWNEFGHKGTAPAPPRPFFRSMIAKDSPKWSADLGAALIASDGYGPKALSLMGEEIKDQLVTSINDFTTPGLAASTIRRKGFKKPLIDTGHMLRSVDFRVE